MKYNKLSHLLWLEKEMQVISNPDSYLHKTEWAIGEKKNLHPLSQKVVEASKKHSVSRSEEDKNELMKLIEELKKS